jgi:archaellum component FlaF (FlaF/FlaG flagellin family)
MKNYLNKDDKDKKNEKDSYKKFFGKKTKRDTKEIDPLDASTIRNYKGNFINREKIVKNLPGQFNKTKPVEIVNSEVISNTNLTSEINTSENNGDTQIKKSENNIIINSNVIFKKAELYNAPSTKINSNFMTDSNKFVKTDEDVNNELIPLALRNKLKK